MIKQTISDSCKNITIITMKQYLMVTDKSLKLKAITIITIKTAFFNFVHFGAYIIQDSLNIIQFILMVMMVMMVMVL